MMHHGPRVILNRCGWAERLRQFVAALIAAMLLVTCPCSAAVTIGRWERLYDGVHHAVGIADEHEPRRQVVHALRIDLANAGIALRATTGNGDAPLETDSQTATSFLIDTGVQAAVNTHFYTPCCSSSPQPKDLIGLAIAQGTVVSPAQSEARAALLFGQDNSAWLADTEAPGFNSIGAFTAIAGSNFVLGSEFPLPSTPDLISPARTLAGIGDRAAGDHRFLYLLTIDEVGGLSEGATRASSGSWLQRFGAHTGINLDGGGSTSMVRSDGQGGATRLNAGSGQRSNGSHLGIFAEPAAGPDLEAYQTLWLAGVRDNSVADFSLESGSSNPQPGNPAAVDDDYYFAGSYDAPIGTLLTDEPVAFLERAVVPSVDRELRFHFNLTAAEARPENELRFSTRVFQQDGSGSRSTDLQVWMNGIPVEMATLTAGDDYRSGSFLAGAVQAVAGENVLAVQGMGGTAAWTTFDFFQLEYLTPVLVADFDQDGDVDGDDFLTWQMNFGRFPDGGGTHSEGDTDGDGDVDGTDFLRWQREFNQSGTAGERIAVPETAAATLALSAAVALLHCRRRRGPGPLALTTLAIASAVAALSPSVHAGEAGRVVTIYRDGVPHVDRRGRRRTEYDPDRSFFPIGTWGTPESRVYRGIDYRWSQLVDAHFNTVWPWAMGGYTTEAQLRQADEHNLQVVVMRRPDPAEMDRIKDHPRLMGIVWQDEPLINFGLDRQESELEAFREYRAAVHEVAPEVPVFVNTASWMTGEGRPWFVAWHQAGDISCHDNYVIWPVTRSLNRGSFGTTKNGIGDAFDLVLETTAQKKPAWLIVAAFEDTHPPTVRFPFSYPTPLQLRGMVYSGIIHGATAITYFQWDSNVGRFGMSPQGHEEIPGRDKAKPLQAIMARALWQTAAQINREINDLVPSILSPTVGPELAYQIEYEGEAITEAPLRSLLKPHPDGGYVMLTVNMDNTVLKGTFRFPRRLVSWQAMFENREVVHVERDANSFRDDFEPYDAHVYRLVLQE